MRCYQCNSIMQPTCNDPFDNRTDEMKPCNDTVVMCRKIIQEGKLTLAFTAFNTAL